MWSQFDYLKPSKIDEILNHLSKYGDEAVIFSGGTDLLVSMRAGGIKPKYIIDIKAVPELSQIKYEKKLLTIGGTVTIGSLARSGIVKKEFAILLEAAKVFGSPQIRNKATIGGNICRSSPSADMATPLLVMDAKVKVISKKGERSIPVNKFFLGPEKTCLKHGEILKEIQMQAPSATLGTAFLKIRRAGFDLAIVNVAVALSVYDNKFEHVRIALGGVAPTPMRASKAEKQLRDKACTEENVEKAAETAAGETSPISDIRSSAGYRREVSKVLVRRAVKQALEKVGGETWK